MTDRRHSLARPLHPPWPQDVSRGQVLCKPGSVKSHTDFEAEIYCLKKEASRPGGLVDAPLAP